MRRVLNWYVVSGGPDSGKTTIIKRLAKLGYRTVPEYARLLIDKEMKKGNTLEGIRKNSTEFQNKVARLKIEIDKKAPKDRIVFFDRGLPDVIAYYRFLQVKPPKSLDRLSRNRYKKVFMLDMLPYKKDYARNESKKDALKIHRLIKRTYQGLGYRVIRIPVMAVAERVELILKRVKG